MLQGIARGEKMDLILQKATELEAWPRWCRSTASALPR